MRRNKGRSRKEERNHRGWALKIEKKREKKKKKIRKDKKRKGKKKRKKKKEPTYLSNENAPPWWSSSKVNGRVGTGTPLMTAGSDATDDGVVLRSGSETDIPSSIISLDLAWSNIMSPKVF